MVKTRDLKTIIGCLFSSGADPTIKSGIGLTPRQIAEVHKFKIGSALLGKLTTPRFQIFHIILNRNP